MDEGASGEGGEERGDRGRCEQEGEEEEEGSARMASFLIYTTASAISLVTYILGNRIFIRMD